MHDIIIQIATEVVASETGMQQVSLYGLSKSGILYSLISNEQNIPAWVKVSESPIINN